MSSTPRKTLEKVLSGASDANIRFSDLFSLLVAVVERMKGSHHIFTRPGVLEIVNIQPLADGKAKHRQVR